MYLFVDNKNMIKKKKKKKKKKLPIFKNEIELCIHSRRLTWYINK